jgi:hypothetical protein
MQLDLRGVGDDAAPGGLGGADKPVGLIARCLPM